MAGLAMVAILIASGCIGPVASEAGPGSDGPGEPTAGTPCEHPWPCADGSEWPPGLTGPFELGATSLETVEAEDGVAIRGWVLRPAVPDGVRVPVVMIPSPYWGTAWASPGTWPEFFATPETDYLAEPLVRAGFAVAAFSSRGTGVSGGCMPWYHAIEGRDMAAVATWLGEQEWSNGRVGATGISYEGTLNWGMAVAAPEALKTIVPLAATGPNAYTHLHTPQGAAVSPKWPYAWVYDAPVTVHGPEATAAVASTVDERLCDAAAQRAQRHATSKLTDQRNEGFYAERDMAQHLGDVTAAVWIVHNFNDVGPVGGMHGMEDDTLWDALINAPKAMRLGWTGHLDPARGEPGFPVHSQDPALVAQWHADLIAWYDFWLKGVAGTDALDTVLYELDDGTQLTSRAWPPAEAADEVLYLAGAAMASEPTEASATYLTVPSAAIPSLGYAVQEAGLAARWGPAVTACKPPTTVSDGVAFISGPLADATVLAGNPMAYLLVSSAEPRGVIATYLFDLGPDGTCDPRFLSFGAANLALHATPYEPTGFPMDEPTHVRIDLSSLATRIPAGHRIALVASAGDPGDVGVRVDRLSRISILGDGTEGSSHIVLPVIEGGLEGDRPSLTYPLRPFTPAWYDAVDPYRTQPDDPGLQPLVERPAARNVVSL